MERYVEVNNEVTIKSLESNRDPANLPNVIKRLEDVKKMVDEYLHNEMKVFDIGTKDGLFFDVLMEHGFHKSNLYGIDCCQEVVDMCVEKGYDVYKKDIQNMLILQSFDFIFMVHTLEHIPNPQIAIAKCVQMLNPNGFIFIEVPIQQYEDPELWGHYHTFDSHDKVKNLFLSDFNVLKEDWQKTPSKKPWYRVLFQKK